MAGVQPGTGLSSPQTATGPGWGKGLDVLPTYDTNIFDNTKLNMSLIAWLGTRENIEWLL